MALNIADLPRGRVRKFKAYGLFTRRDVLSLYGAVVQ